MRPGIATCGPQHLLSTQELSLSSSVGQVLPGVAPGPLSVAKSGPWSPEHSQEWPLVHLALSGVSFDPLSLLVSQPKCSQLILCDP